MNNEISSCEKEANVVIFSNTDEVEDILLNEISQTEKGQKKTTVLMMGEHGRGERMGNHYGKRFLVMSQ